ncbi:MAG: twin transmembrane helix small protein [Rhodospirillales bacterium]
MEGFFTILLIIALAMTLLVLFVGIGAFAVGGKFSQKYSNKLMRLRVLMQGLAVILFATLMILSGK